MTALVVALAFAFAVLFTWAALFTTRPKCCHDWRSSGGSGDGWVRVDVTPRIGVQS